MRGAALIFVALLLPLASIDSETDGAAIGFVTTARAEEPSAGRRLRIRLTTSGTPGQGHMIELPASAPPPGIDKLALVAEGALAGPPPRHRGREIGHGQLAVVALSSDGRELWRNVFPDPRLLRAEVADESGNFVLSRRFYRKTVEFSIVVPADPDLGAVVILEPQWTGAAFVPRLLGRIELN